MSNQALESDENAGRVESEPFRSEPSILPPGFERFYRATLRRVDGARLRSSLLLSLYLDWVAANGGEVLTHQTMRDLMRSVGHDRLKSNGIRYLDVALAVDHPDMPDNLQLMTPRERIGTARADGLIALLDHAMVQLKAVRRVLTDALPQPGGAVESLTVAGR